MSLVSTNGHAEDAEEVVARELAHELEQELANLSLEEHEKALFSVHGLTTVQEEDPIMLDEKLKEFDAALVKILEKPAYDLVMSLNPAYVDREFKLMFLRSQEFEAGKAANAMVLHFENKRLAFGDGEILARDILQSDLSQDDLDFLHRGPVQVFPSRDAAGRMIMAMVSFDGELTPELMMAMMKSMFYLALKICRDNDAQKLGCVWIKYQYDGDIQKEFKMFHEMKMQMCQFIPFRSAGGHFCARDPAIQKYVTAFQLEISEYERFRIRCHVGNQDEIDFSLQTYGIPTDDSPMQKDGSWSVDWHRNWLARLQQQEDLDRTQNSIIVPRRFDVLLGKTKRSLDHTGNRRQALMCEMQYQEYCEATKPQKTGIADRIVTMIHESGGRFLKWDNQTGWAEVETLVARNKVAHTFRHLRAKKQKTDDESKALQDEKTETDTTSVSEASSAEDPAVEKRPSPLPSDVVMYNALSLEENKRGRKAQRV